MSTKQTIAIIGATGKMGSAIAKSIAGGNYRLLLFSRDEHKSRELAEELRQINEDADVEISCCQHEACWEADIILPAVPYNQQEEIAAKIKDVATQKIVVSIINPQGITKTGLSAAEELQQLLPHSKLIKAFNTNLAATLHTGNPSALVFIAGDDKEALTEIQELIQTAGFQPVKTGSLSSSRTLEDLAQMLMNIDRQREGNGKTGLILTTL